MEVKLLADGAIRVAPAAEGPEVTVRLLMAEQPPKKKLVDPRLARPLVFNRVGVERSFVAEIVTPSGVKVKVRLNVDAVGQSAVDLDLETTVLEGSAELGLQQVLEIELPEGESPVYLPGVWINGNPKTAAGAPSAREAEHWSFRDDRLAWPAAISLIDEGRWSAALLRKQPAGREIEYPLDRGYRHTGPFLFDPDECDVGAVGFAARQGRRTLLAHLPFAELPKSYQDKRKLVAPAAGFYRAQTGATWTVGYRLKMARTRDAYDAFADAFHEGCRLWRPTPPPAGDRSLSAIRSAICGRLSKLFFAQRGRRGVAGFYTFVDAYTTKPIVGFCEPAFTGKAFWHAWQLIRQSQATGDAGLMGLGEAVFDSWLERGLRRGLIPDFWARNLGKIPLDIPFCFDPPLVYPHNPTVSLRRLAESTIALVEASRLRPDKTNWKKVSTDLLDRLCGSQLASGGFPRRMKIKDGSPLEKDNHGAAPSVAVALINGYRFTGNDRYLRAAVRTGDFLLRRMVEPVSFAGSTLDADCEDKEAATATLEALRLLYEQTGEERFVAGARRAAWMSVLWFCLTDVPFAKGSVLDQWNLLTRGLTLVSTENNHSDIYLFSTPGDLRWLGGLDKDPDLNNLAWTSLVSALQILPTERNVLQIADEHGYRSNLPEGLAPEVLQQTWWVYLNLTLIKKQRRQNKGYFDHKTSLWTVASILNSLDRMRETVSQEEWNQWIEP